MFFYPVCQPANGEGLWEVQPAYYAEPLGPQSGKDASMSRWEATAAELLLLCTRQSAVNTDREAGDGTVHDWSHSVCRSGVHIPLKMLILLITGANCLVETHKHFPPDRQAGAGN